MKRRLFLKLLGSVPVVALPLPSFGSAPPPRVPLQPVDDILTGNEEELIIYSDTILIDQRK